MSSGNDLTDQYLKFEPKTKQSSNFVQRLTSLDCFSVNYQYLMIDKINIVFNFFLLLVIDI